MIVRDSYLVGVAGHPAEDDTPPIIDTNAVITLQITPQAFQAIAGRRQEVLEAASGIQHIEFSQRHRMDIWRDPAGRLGFSTMKQVLGCLVAKRDNHQMPQA